MTKDWSKIAVIDTENASASLYSDLGDYNTIELSAPYSPERYIQAIETCEKGGMEVIIIDSLSHLWEAEGGFLQMVDQETARMRTQNSYVAWGKITPIYLGFLRRLLNSKCHIITTTRRKQDVLIGTDEKGKMTMTKAGTKEIMREGFEYELTLNFEIINENHYTKASKDRTGLFANSPEFVIDQEAGTRLIEWADKGIEEPKKVLTQAQWQKTKELLKSGEKTLEQVQAVCQLTEAQLDEWAEMISREPTEEERLHNDNIEAGTVKPFEK